MAGGNFGGGTGTVLSPFLIEDAVDLNAVRNQPSGKYFKLVADIDLSLANLTALGLGDSGKGWKPIQSSNLISFSGYFNFNFHKITNLYINRPGEDCIGLFNRLAAYDDITNTISKPRIENVDIRGRNYVGALAGEWGGNETGRSVGILENVSISGTRIQGVDYVGGIIGSMYADGQLQTPSLKNTKVDILEISGSTYVGGIFGIYFRVSSPTVNTYPKIYNTLVISDRIYGTKCIGGLIGGTNQTSGQPVDCNTCYVHIKKYERVYGTETTFGELAGNITGTFTRCYVLDTREFISA